MNKQVATEVWTLQTISKNNIAFIIPSYQRPYVWHDDDVLKLFDDIVAAYKNNDSHYFIGTVLTAKNNQSKGLVYELVDGQQRTTTLMLMSLAFKDKGILVHPLSNMATLNQQPRLNFAIREQVQALLGYWAGLKGYLKPVENELDENPFLIRIYGALKVLKDRLEQYEVVELSKIASYIFEKVQWVNNLMPPDMDVNRLFATANTSGIQLEQTDILKAFLHKNIKTDKARYEAIWQACEQMDNYFERNVKQIFAASDWKTIQPEMLVSFDAAKFLLKHEQASQLLDKDKRRSISDLAVDTTEIRDIKDQPNPSGDLSVEDDIRGCRSIVSFALLLLHAYRVFLCKQKQNDIEGKLHSDRLIKAFKPLIDSSEENIKVFFGCLWQVRFQFDCWIVKWLKQSEDNEQHLTLTKIDFSNSNQAIQRTHREASKLTALQGVSYFTSERSTQYWLTPLLGWLLEKPQSSKQEVLHRLEEIDDQLSLTQLTQKEASYALLKGGGLNAKNIDNIIIVLNGSKGTGFERYWFQKLEYLLLKYHATYLEGIDKEKLESYRITSKNSIEHVHPQNEEYGSKLPDEFLHAFGNLVLLSVGQNSSYGNKSVSVKESMFKDKASLDSLKLAHIFLTKKSQNAWDETAITQHQEDMLALLKKHYQ